MIGRGGGVKPSAQGVQEGALRAEDIDQAACSCFVACLGERESLFCGDHEALRSLSALRGDLSALERKVGVGFESESEGVDLGLLGLLVGEHLVVWAKIHERERPFEGERCGVLGSDLESVFLLRILAF